jgi:hypothetical protein
MREPDQPAKLDALAALRSRLVLQRALEASLARSRAALLALDLGGLATQTREQRLLSQELVALNASSERIERTPRGPGTDPGHLRSQTLEQLRASALRIQSAIRLQLALLARSQHKLQVMANMLAETGALYGPLAGAGVRVASSVDRGIGDLCQA